MLGSVEGVWFDVGRGSDRGDFTGVRTGRIWGNGLHTQHFWCVLKGTGDPGNTHICSHEVDRRNFLHKRTNVCISRCISPLRVALYKRQNCANSYIVCEYGIGNTFFFSQNAFWKLANFNNSSAYTIPRHSWLFRSPNTFSAGQGASILGTFHSLFHNYIFFTLFNFLIFYFRYQFHIIVNISFCIFVVKNFTRD